MTKWARPLHALHDNLLTWRRVANACDGPRDLPRGSYYRSIAIGQIRRPSATARRGIAKAYARYCKNDVTGCYKPLERKRRFPMVVTARLGQAINQWRIRHRLTWNQWATKAHELMCDEYREGSEE